MVKVIILILLFLVVVYVYSHIKLKKTAEKTKQINTVKHFHDTYQHLSGMPKNNLSDRHLKNTETYQKYITKYNSSEDYREKL